VVVKAMSISPGVRRRASAPAAVRTPRKGYAVRPVVVRVVVSLPATMR
jgi:hypothetical protein